MMGITRTPANKLTVFCTVPEKFRINHPYPLCVATGLSYQKTPSPTYNNPKIFEREPTLLTDSVVSGAQIEALLQIMSRFRVPLENGLQPGFLLGTII
jgi:hypothetical protein